MKEYSNLHKNHLEAMSLFRDFEILDEKGSKKIIHLLYSNEDKIKSLLKVEKKLNVPLLFMNNAGIIPNMECSYQDENKGTIGRSKSSFKIFYHLNAYTILEEDMNQIIEKILKIFNETDKFNLVSITNNYTPGDNLGENTLLKWQFEFSNEFKV